MIERSDTLGKPLRELSLIEMKTNEKINTYSHNRWGASPVDLTVHWVPLLYTRAGHESKTSCSLLLSLGSEGSNPDGRSIYLLVCFHFY